MRVLFINLQKYYKKRQPLLFRVLLPLSVFAFIIFVIPHFAFAENPDDGWVAGLIKDPILAIAGSIYALGFWLLEISVQTTYTILNTPAIANVWKLVRNLSLSLFGLGILAIAFMNLMRSQIQVWGVNRTIPKLALAVFFVIFSKFICISIINFATALAKTFSEMIDGKIFQGLSDIGTSLTALKGGEVSFGFAVFTLLLSTVCCFIFVVLAAVLLFRSAFLAFMIILSPFAFALSALPLTEKFYKQWWTEFSKWVFFFPICILILTIGMALSLDPNVASTTSLDPTAQGATGGAFIQSFVPRILGLVCIPLAVWFPLKMLGAVGATARQFIEGQKGGRANPAKFARDSWGQRQKNKEESRKNKPNRLTSRLFGDTTMGRFVTGKDKFSTAEEFGKNLDSFNKLGNSAKNYFHENDGNMRGYNGPDKVQAQGWQRKSGGRHAARNVYKAYKTGYEKDAGAIGADKWKKCSSGVLEGLNPEHFTAEKFTAGDATRLTKSLTSDQLFVMHKKSVVAGNGAAASVLAAHLGDKVSSAGSSGTTGTGGSSTGAGGRNPRAEG